MPKRVNPPDPQERGATGTDDARSVIRAMDLTGRRGNVPANTGWSWRKLVRAVGEEAAFALLPSMPGLGEYAGSLEGWADGSPCDYSDEDAHDEVPVKPYTCIDAVAVLDHEWQRGEPPPHWWFRQDPDSGRIFGPTNMTVDKYTRPR